MCVPPLNTSFPQTGKNCSLTASKKMLIKDIKGKIHPRKYLDLKSLLLTNKVNDSPSSSSPPLTMREGLIR